MNGGGGDLESFGRLIRGQSPEEAQLDYASLFRVERGELRECVVHGDQIHCPRFGHGDRIEEVPGSLASALPRVAAPRVLDENSAHRLGGNRKEVSSALPVGSLAADKPQVCLVDDGARLERVACSFAPQVPLRHSMKLVVNEGDEPIQGIPISLPPGEQQPCDLAGRGQFSRALLLYLDHRDSDWPGLYQRVPFARLVASFSVRFAPFQSEEKKEVP